MYHKRTLALILIFAALAVPAAAAEVDSGGQYCFGSGDFSQEALAGICITALPGREVGAVYLGDREIRPGDILAADQLDMLTFQPVRTEADTVATVAYLPVFSDRVGEAATLTISIRGKENQPPIAEDFAAETYKNLPIEGKLKVKEPEGDSMTFTILRQPKRGQVEIREDGSFTYTPKKNKVGIDSFVFTATDAGGKVSRETTVTITIVKPTDSTQYTDTIGENCRFAAEWMKNTGIFVGEKLDGNACFQPEQAVSRGEFLAMLVRTLEIPTERAETLGAYAQNVPQWLRPYLAAAVRAGLTAGAAQMDDYGSPITGAEAALMIRNALDLSDGAVQALAQCGLAPDDTVLTRSDAALALYETSRLAENAPGMVVIGKNR